MPPYSCHSVCQGLFRAVNLSLISAMRRSQTILLGATGREVLEKPGRRAALASKSVPPSGFPGLQPFIKTRRRNFSRLSNMISSGVLVLVSAGVISVMAKLKSRN